MRPFGKKPPSKVNQLAKLALMPDAVGRAKMMTARPPTIMAITATILIMANQNSNSPNLETPSRLAAQIITKNTAADTHVGIAGNQ